MMWLDRQEKYVGGWKDGQPDGTGEHMWYQDAPMEGPFEVKPIEITRTEIVFDKAGIAIEGAKPVVTPEPSTTPFGAPKGSTKKKKEDKELPPLYGAASPFGRFSQINSYKGDMKLGRREGQGRFSYSNGALYEGAWSDNAKGPGKRTQVLKDGTFSIDEYESDRPKQGRRHSICKAAMMNNASVSQVDMEAGIDYEAIMPNENPRLVQRLKDMLIR